MNNIYSSDFIIIIDTDEFPMVDFRLPKPLEQFRTWMRSIAHDDGTIEMDRLEMARPFTQGPPPNNELVQLSFESV